MKPRKHAELIKAWADGATIERMWTDWYGNGTTWLIDNEPDWSEDEEYRIKPEPAPKPEPEKKTLFIYNNTFEGKSWIHTQPPDRTVMPPEWQYMGSIEVLK